MALRNPNRTRRPTDKRYCVCSFCQEQFPSIGSMLNHRKTCAQRPAGADEWK